jgi:hypothetical protein
VFMRGSEGSLTRKRPNRNLQTTQIQLHAHITQMSVESLSSPIYLQIRQRAALRAMRYQRVMKPSGCHRMGNVS